MKLAYLITEYKETALILKHLLPQHLMQVTEIVATSTRSSAQSLAGTLMSKRSRPVALVLNANTIDTSSIQEQLTTITTLLLPASSGEPYQVFLAAPTVVILLQNATSPKPISELLAGLSTEQIQSLQQLPLLQQITQFLTNAFAQAA
ncbi:MAG: hypothetical protein PUP91_07515 [Rhizonema sp. PD37]|nr:hypothetical protein [Rhizonema sp. PD37]